MTRTEIHRDAMEQEQDHKTEDKVVKSDGVLLSVLRVLFWPFGIVVRAFWWMLGVREAQGGVPVSLVVISPGRQNLAGRKRLSRITRLLLSVLPRWVQGTLGYPVSSNIGRALSPEIRVSPTKPSGKGSKRKQDELDEEEGERPTWVEALVSQELTDDDAPDEDPDYEPTSVETESEEYRSHNSTESDLEFQNNQVVIGYVETGLETQSEVSPVASPIAV